MSRTTSRSGRSPSSTSPLTGASAPRACPPFPRKTGRRASPSRPTAAACTRSTAAATPSRSTTIAADGSLSQKTTPTVSTGLTPRSIAVSPTGLYAYVTNTDGTLHVYDAAPDGSLTFDSLVGLGSATPRGVTVSRDGNSVYVADFGSHLTPGGILQFDVAGSGALSPKASPEIGAGNSPVEVAVSLDGKSLYASNFNGGDDLPIRHLSHRRQPDQEGAPDRVGGNGPDPDRADASRGRQGAQPPLPRRGGDHRRHQEGREAHGHLRSRT